MKTCLSFWAYLAKYLSVWNFFRTNISCHAHFLRMSYSLRDNYMRVISLVHLRRTFIINNGFFHTTITKTQR
jgi:hypothetical protein